MADKAEARRLVARGDAFQKRGAFYDAVRAYQQAILADADFAPAYTAWGRALADRGRHKEAVAKYVASIQREAPADETWKAIEASLTELTPRTAELERIWRTLKNSTPTDTWHQWGELLLSDGEWAAAEEVFRAAVIKAPTAVNYRGLGRALMGRGKTIEALTQLQRAIELDPSLQKTYGDLRELLKSEWPSDEPIDRDTATARIDDAVNRIAQQAAYVGWAEVLQDLGRHKAAIRVLEASARSTVPNARALWFWAYSLQALGRSAEVLEKVDAVLECVARGESLPGPSEGMSARAMRIRFFNPLQGVSSEALEPLHATATRLDDARVFLAFGNLLSRSGNALTAVAAFEAAALKDPTSAEPDAAAGRALLQLKLYERAVTKGIAALRRDPAGQGHLLERNRLLADALEAWEEASSSKTDLVRDVQAVIDEIDRVDVYARWGRFLMTIRRYAEAIVQFEAAQRLGSLEIELYSDWVSGLAHLGKHSEALAKCADALRIDPKHAVLAAYAPSSLREFRGEEQNKQISALQQTVDATADADTTLVWGAILARLGRHAEAIAQCEKVSKLRPDSEAHRVWAESLAVQGDVEDALKQYLLEIEVNPDRVRNHGLPGLRRTLPRIEDESAAVQTVQTVVDRLERSWLYMQWGLLLTGLNRHTQAEVQLRRAIEKGDQSVQTQLYLGHTLGQLERYDDAISTLQQVQDGTSTEEERSATNFHWAVVLLSKGQAQEALSYYRRATKAPWDLFSMALALDKLGDYEAAVGKYTEAFAAAGSDLMLQAYSKHNIAVVRTKQGNYKAASEAWKSAIKLYEAVRPTAVDQEYIEFLMYFGWACEKRQAFTKAEECYRAGLELNPKHTGLLTSIAKLYRTRLRHPSVQPEADGPGKTHWTGWHFYQKAQRILSERFEREKTLRSTVDLGALHLAMEAYDEAEKAFQHGVGRDHPLIGDVHEGLAVVNVRSAKYVDAISGFRKALDRDRSNFDLWSNLAEAYFKANQSERSEMEYRALLRVAPGHIDALIGLGQLYVAMGDTAHQAGRKADADDMFSRAIVELTKALQPADSESISRQLDDPSRSAAAYARGYARVKVFEGQPVVKQDFSLLETAMKDFQQVHEDHENYQKAQRAVRMLLERLEPPVRLAEEWAPRIMFVLVLFVFLAAQVVFFACIETRHDVLRVTSADVEKMKVDGLPEDAAKKVRELASEQFNDPAALSARVTKVLGNTSAQMEPVVMKHASTMRIGQRLIEAGSYLTLTFGALIFMIAALYLNQISKLKFGTIELEKSSGDLIKSSPSLGINR